MNQAAPAPGKPLSRLEHLAIVARDSPRQYCVPSLRGLTGPHSVASELGRAALGKEEQQATGAARAFTEACERVSEPRSDTPPRVAARSAQRVRLTPLVGARREARWNMRARPLSQRFGTCQAGRGGARFDQDFERLAAPVDAERPRSATAHCAAGVVALGPHDSAGLRPWSRAAPWRARAAVLGPPDRSREKRAGLGSNSQPNRARRGSTRQPP